jgi:hypothetical protein
MTRTDEEGRPLDLQPIGGGSRGPVVLGAVLVVAIVVAMTKPWSWGAPPPTPAPSLPRPTASLAPPRSSSSPAASPTPAVTSDVLGPPATPAPAGEGLIQCFSIDAWRLLTISRSGPDLIRTWTAVSPRTLGGPGEVTEFARVTDGDVLNVGYCGPTVLLGGPAMLVTTTAWSVPSIGLPRLLGPLNAAYFSNSASRGLYRRPAAIRAMPAEVWPPGRYVLHLVAARPDDVDLWFGVEIVDVDALGTPSPPVPRPSVGSSASPSR